MAGECRLLLLGPPRVVCGEEVWTLPTSRGLALFAYLAGRPEGERRNRLAYLLWNAPEQTARHRLRQELYRLRGTPIEKYIRSDRERVWLEGLASDTNEFVQHVENGAWDEAIALWRGRFMEGFGLNQAETFEDWLLIERETWCNRYVSARSRRALVREAAGDLSGASEDWRGILSCDPLSEDAVKQLLRLLATLERWQDVEEVLGNYRSEMKARLDLEPEAGVLRLYEQLKTRQPPPQTGTAPLPEVLDRPPLVGRDRILKTALESRRPLLISGAAGSGKSRLARELLLRLGGGLVVEHGAAGSSLPYAGVIRALDAALSQRSHPDLEAVWLREAGRLVPHHLPAANQPIRNAAEQMRFLEGAARTLLALAGPALVWEDLQWTDPASLELLSLLIGLARDTRLIITLRTPLETEKVAGWLKNAREGRELVEIELPPLGEDEVHELIKMMAHQQAGARLFSRRLYAATGGNPFFVIETLRHLFAGGQLRLSDRGWSTPYDRTTTDYRELPLPSSVREVLRGRISSLDGSLRRSLQLVAMAEEPVSAADLAAVLGIGELEAAGHLEALREKQLLREEKGGYAAAHDHLRQLLLQTAPTSLPTYHRAWARSLEERGELARSAEHWRAAGDPARAAANLIAAARGQAPRNTLAALALYERAVELAAALPEDEAVRARLELYELRLRLGRLQESDLKELAELAAAGNPLPRLLLAEAALQRGDYQTARNDAALGLELAIALDEKATAARAHFLLAWIHYRYGDPEAQLGELEKALRAFEEAGDVAGSARTLRNLAALNFRLGRKLAGDALQNRAERLARKAGDALLALRIRADRITGMWLRGEYPEALRRAKRLLADARRLGDLGGILDGLELVGLALHRLGDNAAALERFSEFATLAERFGIEKDLALALSERALPLIELKSWREAEDDLKRALEIQTRLGDQAKLGHTYHTLGYLYLRQGEPARAENWLLRAAAHWRGRGEKGHLARSLALAALAAAARGQHEQAKNHSRGAFAAAQDWPVGVPDLAVVLAVYAQQHDDEKAALKARQILAATSAKLRGKRRKLFEQTFAYELAGSL